MKLESPSRGVITKQRSFLRIVLVAAFACQALVLVAEAGEFTYQNPIEGGPCWIRDPFIIRVGDKYFMTGTYKELGKDGSAAWPGFKLWSSEDILHWKDEGFLLRNEDIRWGNARLWAPEIRFHPRRRKYYFTYNVQWNKTDRQGSGLAVADEVRGPYTNLTPDEPLAQSNDASLFFDDDGRTYLLQSSITICEVDLDQVKVVRHKKRLLVPEKEGAWDSRIIEGPNMVKINGTYYLFWSATGWGYMVGYATAEDVWGPYTKHTKNPIYGAAKPEYESELNEPPDCPFDEVGHGSLFKGPDGRWWLSSHGYGYEPGPFRDPRLCIDPLNFDPATGEFSAKLTWKPQTIRIPDNLKVQGAAYICELKNGVESSPDRIIKELTAHNRAVHIMDYWMRDPYIVLAPDGWYYLTCTRLNHIDGGKEGIQVWRSRDMAAWKNYDVLWTFDDSKWIQPLAAQARLEHGKAHLWAPELHLLDGRWIAVHTTSFRRANLLVNQGPDLKGPFREPMAVDFGHRHDPSIFTDDDGMHWLVWACAKIAPLKPDMSGFAGPEVRIGPSNRILGHEGCVIRKIGSKYVLFGTAWSTDQMRKGTYNLYYCTSDTVTGPYGPRKFAGRFCGHGTPFRDKQDRWWTTAFLNGRYVSPEHVTEHGTDPSEAQTINRQGLTLVPLNVRIAYGDVYIRAKDPDYANPGPEEVQKFPD